MCYTQGLFHTDNNENIFQSCGLYGHSMLELLTYPELNIIKRIHLESRIFGEGIAKCKQYLYLLSWEEREVLKFVYNTLQYIETLPLPQEMKSGWGLSSTSNDTEWIATDGTNKIYFLDCENNLKVTKTIEVVGENNWNIYSLNDWCYANGYIYLNRYYTSHIYKVISNTGRVAAIYNMNEWEEYELQQGTLTIGDWSSGKVWNGIAYRESNKTFLLTGKQWGYYYEILFDE